MQESLTTAVGEAIRLVTQEVKEGAGACPLGLILLMYRLTVGCMPLAMAHVPEEDEWSGMLGYQTSGGWDCLVLF